MDSLFSCVLIHGKIAAATNSWWSLHPEEIKLLALLAQSENTSSSKDIPVFLPYKSPTVISREVHPKILNRHLRTGLPHIQIASEGFSPLLFSADLPHVALGRSET